MVKRDSLEAFYKKMEEAKALITSVPEIKSGDRVFVNSKQILGRKNSYKLAPSYLDFVKDSSGKVYTATKRTDTIIGLCEAPWLFWKGDLILVPKE